MDKTIERVMFLTLRKQLIETDSGKTVYIQPAQVEYLLNCFDLAIAQLKEVRLHGPKEMSQTVHRILKSITECDVEIEEYVATLNKTN